MRRIYESDALVRDDGPHTPSEQTESKPGPGITANQHRSLVDWGRASHALVPTWIRDRALAVSVETDRDVYAPDEPVNIRVVVKNRLPFPIAIRTPTRRRWDWSVDGARRAEESDFEGVPAEPALFSFHRSETKTFTRTWLQRVRTAPDRWEPAEVGSHVIASFVDVDESAARGLAASTEIDIRD